MNNVGLFTILFFTGMFLFLSGCQKDDKNHTDAVVSSRSFNASAANLPSYTKSWLEDYLQSQMTDDQASQFLNYFSFKWDRLQKWSDSTIVIPARHFDNEETYTPGYTRLFIHKLSADSTVVALYSVIPDSLDVLASPEDIINNFQGSIAVFDVRRGLVNVMRYEEGKLLRFWKEVDILQARSFPWYEHFKSSNIRTDGKKGNGAPDDNVKHNGNWCWRFGCSCGGGGENEGETIIYVDLNSVTTRPGSYIHNIGTRRLSNEGAGGSGSGGNGSSSSGSREPSNPVDSEGLHEAIRQALLKECLATASKEFLGYANLSKFVDVCTGTPIDVMAALEEMCVQNKPFTKEELDKAISGQNYIDLNDIPIHKSDCGKTDEQNIQDFVKFMRENDGCSKIGFDAALNKYLGFSKTLLQPDNSFSATNKMCDKILKVTPSANNSNYSAIGLQNLPVRLLNNIHFSYDYLTLNIPTPTRCSLTVEDIFTAAFNNAITKANENIRDGKPIYEGVVNGKTFKNNNAAFMVMLKILIDNIGTSNACLAPGLVFSANPVSTNFPDRSFDCAPVFVDITKIDIRSLCP